jgi:hypothetical protein
MILHFDNATRHGTKCTIDSLKANRLTRAPHPVFSLDLAPSDFCLFGKLKMAMMSTGFADGEPLQGMMEVLNGISREGLQDVFEECLLRFDSCIQTNKEYEK